MTETKNDIVLKKIVEYINDYNHIDIRDKNRESHYVFCRAVYFKAAVKFVPASLTTIAKEVNRHHATAIHARSLFDEVSKYGRYKKMYDDVCEYMSFVHNEDLLSNDNSDEIEIAFLMKRVKTIEKLLEEKEILLSSQKKMIGNCELEEHEIRYRDLPLEKKDIFRERVNAILKMI